MLTSRATALVSSEILEQGFDSIVPFSYVRVLDDDGFRLTLNAPSVRAFSWFWSLRENAP
jgi:hypothetical protein